MHPCLIRQSNSFDLICSNSLVYIQIEVFCCGQDLILAAYVFSKNKGIEWSLQACEHSFFFVNTNIGKS